MSSTAAGNSVREVQEPTPQSHNSSEKDSPPEIKQESNHTMVEYLQQLILLATIFGSQDTTAEPPKQQKTQLQSHWQQHVNSKVQQKNAKHRPDRRTMQPRSRKWWRKILGVVYFMCPLRISCISFHHLVTYLDHPVNKTSKHSY